MMIDSLSIDPSIPRVKRPPSSGNVHPTTKGRGKEVSKIGLDPQPIPEEKS